MFINYTHSSCRATSQHVPFLEYLEHCFPHPRGRRHDGHAGGFQGGYFVPGAALAARDYGASMSHASTGGRGEAGDEGHHWFLRAAVYDKLRGFLLRGTSDSPIMMMPSVCGSNTNFFKQSTKLVPLNGSPPIPTTVLCPSPATVVW